MRTVHGLSLQHNRLQQARRILASHDSEANPALDKDSAPGSEGWRLGLAPGLHEWFPSKPERPPPLTVLIALLWQSLDDHPGGVAGPVLWIGRSCWPYPLSLVRHTDTVADRHLLDASVFIDAGRSRSAGADLVWSIEQAARCPGVRAVVADGSGLTMAESRRLQIAAERDRQRGGTPIQIVRSAHERGVLSASRSRWRVTTEVSKEHDDRTQGWTVELLRCKGMQPDAGGARRWCVRREHGSGNQARWEPIVGPASRDGDLDDAVARRHRPSAQSRTA